MVCGDNQLESLDLRNGNNQALWYFSSIGNPSLNCIDVDDVSWAEYSWARDTWTQFSTNCNPSSIQEHVPYRKLIKVVDMFGRVVIPKPNVPLFYIYDDGTTEKRLIIQ